jgi:hypothetical protein
MRYLPRLQDIAERNDGLIARTHISGSGLPAYTLVRAEAAGVVEAVQPGVWRLVGVPVSYDQMVRAALLSAGLGAAVSHRSAAHLLGLRERTSDAVDITVPRGRRPRLRSVSLHRSLDLTPSHVRQLKEMSVTTPERTLADLGDVIARGHVAWAVEHAVIEQMTTIGRLWALLDELGRQGRNGRGALREALEDWLFSERPPDSVLEVMLARVVRRFGLPEPEYQAEIWRGKRFIARVDACWRDLKIVTEVDGLHAHATSRQLQHDVRRQNELIALGFTVLRFTWPDVVRTPERVAEQLLRELARARAA